MFNPYKEVVSLKTAKKLKEIGFPQGGDGWYWVKLKTGEWVLAIMLDGIWYPAKNYYSVDDDAIVEFYRAPTAQELDEILAYDYEYTFCAVPKKDPYTRKITGYTIVSIDKFGDANDERITAQTEVEAKAKILIRRYENSIELYISIFKNYKRL